MRYSLCAAWILGCCVLAGCEAPVNSPPPAATAPAPAPTTAPAPAPSPLPGESAPPASATPASTPAAKAALIAPVLDDMTVAIINIDAQRADPAAIEAEFKRIQDAARPPLPPGASPPSVPPPSGSPPTGSPSGSPPTGSPSGTSPPSAAGEQSQFAWLPEFKQQIEQVFCVVSLNDVPARSPFAAYKLAVGADSKRVFAFAQTGKFDSPVDQAEFDKRSFTKGELFIVGAESTILRLKGMESPASFPNLEQALQAGAESFAQVVFIPSGPGRDQLGRMMALLPHPLNDEGPRLLSAVRHGVITCNAPPALQIQFQVQAQDASGAERLQQALTFGLQNLKLVPSLSPEMRQLVEAISPQVSGEQISFSMKPGDPAFDRSVAILNKAATAARDVASSEIGRNKLKSLALAMHTYADRNKKLPAAYSSSNGQPLLSWRVHLLPFLEQQALYAQFKLDEPWDSEHNKALINQMPAIYAAQGSDATTGLTPFLVPRGENMIFNGDQGVGFPDVTDGTANTLLLIDAGPDKAVIWTSPEDWQVDTESPLAGLPSRFNTAMCDGATRPFRNDADPKQFMHVLTRNDGQVVDVDDLAYGDSGQATWVPSFSLADLGLTPKAKPALPGEGSLPGNPDERGPIPPGAIGPDGRPLPPSNESPFITQAKKAFTEGRDKDGFDCLYAEVVAGADKDGLRKMIRWFDGAKRPAMAIRWGVAINYTAPANYNAGPSPVGRIVTSQGGGGGGDSSSAPQLNAAPAAVLDYFTAELGTKLLEGLRTRADQGQFGEVLAVIASTPGVTSNNSSPSSYSEPTGSGPPGAANNKTTEFKPQPLAPGVIFLGVGKDKDLLAKAKKEEVDALVIYTIKVEPQQRVVVNSTKLSLFELNKGTKLGDSKLLKATQVEIFRKEKEKGIDPVEDMMQKFFALIDANFKLGDLPASATPDKMLAHATKLAESEPTNKLPTMVAIAYYQDKGSLSKDDIAAAYGKLTDEATGKQLVGSPAEKKKAMADLLPKPPPPPPGPDGQPGSGTPKRMGLGGSTAEGASGERGP